MRGIENGCVRVSSKRAGSFHEVVISDNGRGFDTSAAESADGTHIGIRNVRERLRSLCGGSLTIESLLGEGTKVTIRIPAEKDGKQ